MKVFSVEKQDKAKKDSEIYLYLLTADDVRIVCEQNNTPPRITDRLIKEKLYDIRKGVESGFETVWYEVLSEAVSIAKSDLEMLEEKDINQWEDCCSGNIFWDKPQMKEGGLSTFRGHCTECGRTYTKDDETTRKITITYDENETVVQEDSQ